MTSIQDPVATSAPLKSPLRYPGGKCRVAKTLLRYAPEHSEYRELFAGGAGVFFHKPLAQSSWLNDLHPGLYAFYAALRDNYDAFAEQCRKQDGGLRARFNYWTKRRDLMDSAGDENILERAVQYYFLNRTVWGGRVVFDPKRKSRLYFSNPDGWRYLDKKLAHLKLVSRKLHGVQITCQDYAACLNDTTAGTFIYADPPYVCDTDFSYTSKLYENSFTMDCHRRLAERLSAIPAKVMISYDDCPLARELYSGGKWHFVELQWKYCGTHAVSQEAKAAGRKEKKVDGKELLILNYPPPGDTAAGSC